MFDPSSLGFRLTGQTAPRPYDSEMLHGRERELALIDRLLEGARSGEGGSLLLSGEPGIGKSALLAEAAERADGMRVLRASGVEAESAIAYAALHQLLLPAMSGIDRLPEPQHRALSAAFGLSPGESPARFLVSVAVLTLLSDLAGEQPLLCLLDDVHWADRASFETAAFVARRLEAEPVALLLATREGDGLELDGSGIERLPVVGLDAGSASALLADRLGDRVVPAVREHLIEATGGNPLALSELPEAPEEPGEAPFEPIRLAGRLERAYLDRVRSLAPGEQALLLLAAAEGTGHVRTVRGAAELLELDLAPLESGDLAGFVRVDGPDVVFGHPLVRSAVYHGASPADRAAVHRALADVRAGKDDEADRRAWHLGQAAEGPDESVALELERSAHRALRRSGHLAAAAALEQSANVSEDSQPKTRRLVAAAGAAWGGGDARRASGLLEQAELLGPLEPGVRMDVDYLRGSIELRAGDPTEALRLLLAAARETARRDPAHAVPVLAAAWEAAAGVADRDAMLALGALMSELPACADPREDAIVRLGIGASHGLRRSEPDGSPGALEHDVASMLDGIDDPALLARAGIMAWGVGHTELARRLHSRAVDLARAQGAAGTLAWALATLVVEEMLAGRYASAEAYAEEGRRLALETGQRNSACTHLASLAMVAALRGREEEARRLAGEVLTEATRHRLVRQARLVQPALGLLELAAGSADAALEHYLEMWTSSRWLWLGLVPDLVEAAVRADRAEICAEPLAAYEAWAETTSSARVLAGLACCRALLTTGEEAERHYEEALEHAAAVGHPLEQARTELLYGEFLRRERRRIDARGHLRAALEGFERLGAEGFAKRASAELRASGETARKRDPSTLAELTPQELQIARAAGAGSTNREIAAAFFISPRTVDYHLRKVFRKLGISSRSELIRLSLAPEEELLAVGGS